jgi:hypothetical protein
LWFIAYNKNPGNNNRLLRHALNTPGRRVDGLCVDDTVVFQVPMLTSCTQMHRLKMDECHGVTAASILALSVHCQSVQMLDVTGCDNVPETSVKAAAGVSIALSKGW